MKKEVVRHIRQRIEAHSGAFFLTNTKGTIVYATPSVTKQTEFDVPEMVGKRPGDLWGGNMPATFYKTLWHQIATNTEPFVGTATNKTKQGTAYTERLHVTPIFGRMGAPAYFLAVHTADTRSFLSIFGKRPYTFEGVDTQLFPWLSSSFNQIPLADFFEQVCVAPLDEQLMARRTDREKVVAAQQQPDAFRELYLAYHRDIFSYFFYRVSHDHEIAQDLTHDTFFHAFSHLSSFESRNSSYKTYLLRIAHNLLVNHFRKESRTEKNSVTNGFSELMEERFWQKDTVARALVYLNQSEQAVVRLFYLDGQSIHEVAALLNKTENAVKLLLSRARKRLRLVLSA